MIIADPGVDRSDRFSVMEHNQRPEVPKAGRTVTHKVLSLMTTFEEPRRRATPR